jgi:hypothetical protein
MADASKILLTEGDAPATPAAGIAAFYTKTDHKFYTKGSDGVEQSAGTGTVTASNSPADNEYAKWTSATDIEGRTYAEALTDLFSVAMPVNTTMILPTLATTLGDGEWNGITCPGIVGPAGGLIFGDLVYFNPATNEWLLTDADAAATALGTLGICILAGAENAATNILLWGKVRADAAFPAFTALTTLYMSGTAGDITETAPTGSLGVIRCVGFSNNANEIFFNPSTDYYTLKA